MVEEALEVQTVGSSLLEERHTAVASVVFLLVAEADGICFETVPAFSVAAGGSVSTERAGPVTEVVRLVR